MATFSSNPKLPLSKQFGRAFLLLSVILAIFILLLASNFISPGSKSGQEGKQTKTVFIASGHPELAPIVFRSGSEGLSGVGVDLTKKIFDDLKSPLEFKYMGDWGEVQAKAKTGEVDIIVGVDKNSERMEYLTFSSIPYAESPISLFVPKNKKFTYKGLDSLVGKKGVALVGDSYNQEIDDFIKAKGIDLQRASSSRDAFKMLVDGEADYFIHYLYAGQKTLAGDTTLAEKIKIVPENLGVQNFYIAVSKESPYLSKLGDISKGVYAEKTLVNYLLNKYTYYYTDHNEAK